MPSAGIFGSARVAAGGGGGITATFQTSATSTADASSYTFTSQPIGTAATSRRVVVTVAARGGTGVSAMTIGGVSATLDAVGLGSANWSEIWSAVVPTGTTATVAITTTAAASSCGIGVWTLTGGAPTGQTAAGTVNTATQSMTLTTSAGDVCIGVSSFRSSLTGAQATWNAATDQYDGDVDTAVRKHTGADLTAVGASTDMGLTISSFVADASSCAAAYA